MAVFIDINIDAFEETKHPRAKSGSHGGEFVKKGAGTGGAKAPEQKQQEAPPKPTIYRGLTTKPIEGVESGNFPGLRFFTENPDIARMYSETPGGGYIQKQEAPSGRVLDLTHLPSVEGSEAVLKRIAGGLGKQITSQWELAPALRAAGYSAVKLREHMVGRHQAATTWVIVDPDIA